MAPGERAADRAYRRVRQAAIGIEFGGDVLKPHEVRSIERLVAAGEKLAWIPRLKSEPTHDFVWINRGGIHVELKSTIPKHSTIRGAIEKSVSKAASHDWCPLVKENFVIDIADAALTSELRADLAGYNTGRHRWRIRRLWVLLQEVLLETKERGVVPPRRGGAPRSYHYEPDP